MRRPVFAVCAVVAVVLAASCKSATGPTTESLTGTWHATKAEYVKASDTSVKVDVVSQGSAVTLQLATSTFTFTVNDARVSESPLTGTWTSSKDTLTLAPSGMSFTIVFDMTLNGSTLTLSGGGVTFDFTSTGTFEDAKLNMVLTK
jgi:hypothetical protein